MSNLDESKLQKIQKILSEINISDDAEKLIENNTLIFIVDNIIYRCKMPNQLNQTEANKIKNQVHINLLHTKDILFEEDLKNLLKEKGIDIFAMEQKLQELKKELHQKFLLLAPTMTEEAEKIKQYKEEIKNIKQEFLVLSAKISILLEPSIESQTDKAYLEALTAFCTEKNINPTEEKWEKVWNTYEDFQKDSSKLPNKAIETMAKLLIYIKD